MLFPGEHCGVDANVRTELKSEVLYLEMKKVVGLAAGTAVYK